MQHSRSSEANSCQLLNLSLYFLGTQKFITMHKTACHMSLYWAWFIQSCPIIFLYDPFQHHPSIYNEVFQLISFLQVSPPKTGTHFFLPFATCLNLSNHISTHLILLDLITKIISGKEYKSWSYSICNFLQSVYGSHTFVFITKQNPLFQSSTAQVYFNSISDRHMYGACFSLYLGHPHASNTKPIQRKIH